LQRIGEGEEEAGGGGRQRALINELFSGKGGAYESSDLAAIQRFHATLGQIYAQRGAWAGDGATNARFQFENLLRIADRRERQEGYVQPLQDVKAQLAQGYETLQQPRLARALHLPFTFAASGRNCPMKALLYPEGNGFSKALADPCPAPCRTGPVPVAREDSPLPHWRGGNTLFYEIPEAVARTWLAHTERVVLHQEATP